MEKTIVKVGLASCGVAAGAVPIFETIRKALAGRDDVELKKVGCIGLCYMEPIVEVERNGVSIAYGKVDSDVAKKIGVSDAAVSMVIGGTAVSARISAEIARIIGKPVSEIWPGRAA